MTGVGAEDSIEIMTTSTSGRAGGQSRAKVNKTRRLCLSKIVTGSRLPGIDLQRKEQNVSWRNKERKFYMYDNSRYHLLILTGFD